MHIIRSTRPRTSGSLITGESRGFGARAREEPARRATIVARDKNTTPRRVSCIFSYALYVCMCILCIYVCMNLCIYVSVYVCMIKHVCEHTSCVCVRVDVNQPVHTGRARRKTTPGEYNIIIIIISGRL